MSNLKNAAQQALEALKEARAVDCGCPWLDHWNDAITALRDALAEPVQEPVAYIHKQGSHWEVSERFLYEDEKARGWTEEPLYTHPVDDTALLRQALEALNQMVAATQGKFGDFQFMAMSSQNADEAITALSERLKDTP